MTVIGELFAAVAGLLWDGDQWFALLDVCAVDGSCWWMVIHRTLEPRFYRCGLRCLYLVIAGFFSVCVVCVNWYT